MATDDGAKRAQELNDALLGVPGYADDTMFFVARYGQKCQVRALLPFFWLFAIRSSNLTLIPSHYRLPSAKQTSMQ